MRAGCGLEHGQAWAPPVARSTARPEHCRPEHHQVPSSAGGPSTGFLSSWCFISKRRIQETGRGKRTISNCQKPNHLCHILVSEAVVHPSSAGRLWTSPPDGRAVTLCPPTHLPQARVHAHLCPLHFLPSCSAQSWVAPPILSIFPGNLTERIFFQSHLSQPSYMNNYSIRPSIFYIKLHIKFLL